VGIWVIRDGTGFRDELINTDETNGVTAWDILNELSLSTHHDDSSLDGLLIKIVVRSWLVVGTHDSNLLAGGDGTREDSTEGNESTLIR
jgi:hypothetical protein